MYSILCVTVLAERRTCPILLAAVLPSISWQIFFAAGRINSSSIVKGFITFAIWYATKNYALNAAMVKNVAIFSGCCCAACGCCFCSKCTTGLLLKVG